MQHWYVGALRVGKPHVVKDYRRVALGRRLIMIRRFQGNVKDLTDTHRCSEAFLDLPQHFCHAAQCSTYEHRIHQKAE